MGYIIASTCLSCQFTNRFNFGGGRRSYSTNCPVPAINKETLAFENINYYEHKKTKKYLFYTNRALKKLSFRRVNKIEFSNLKLNADHNYCPSCKNKTLTFQVVGFSD